MTEPGEISPLLDGRRILLGVSGSIAAYKAADLASQLSHLGASVHTVLTAAAKEFIGPATFQAITQNPVLTSLFDEPYAGAIAHIDLAQNVDLILVAPATADILAKMAHGIADDLLTTILLAATAPVLVAPAMNSVMLNHPATRANFSALQERGTRFVDPTFGVLACRTEGPGKLADVQDIVRVVLDMLGAKRDYEGVRVVITAGATREPLDPVRFISNRSSGKMGAALAEAALARGAGVTLITAHTTVTPPERAHIVRVSTTREMLDAARAHFADADLFIAAAAPADYAPQQVSPRKRKKSGETWTLALQETPDVVAAVAAMKDGRFVVGFAAETEDLLANAAAKLRRKNLDLIVANDVTAEGAGFEVDTNVATLLWPDGHSDFLPRMSKRELADRILDAIRPALSGRKAPGA